MVGLSGRYAYVTGGSGVSVFAVNQQTGVLSRLGTRPVPAGSGYHAIVMAPNGKSAYVTNHDSNTVSMYAINATSGTLTGLGAIAAKDGPNAIAVTPNGKTAYVTRQDSDKMATYAINAKTGVLSVLSGPTVTTGRSPLDVAVAPSGKYAYVADYSSAMDNDNGSISMYAINQSTGGLSPLAAQAPAVGAVSAIAVGGGS